jgi:glycosyltransferase involved in cell wall biosynthesis
MLRVVVDLYKLKNLHCGLGQFCLHLGRAMARLEDAAIRPTFFLRRNCAHLVRSEQVDLAYARAWRKEKFITPVRPLLERMLPPQGRFALWHSTDQFCKFWPLDPGVPVLLTIHDLNFLREKSRRKAGSRHRKIQAKVDRASALATDSHFSAQEIRSQLDLKGKPLRVIYCGTTQTRHPGAARPAFLPPGKFLFSIGTLAPRKNFHVLVELLRRLPQYRLVLAGDKSGDYARQIERMVSEAGLESRFLMPGEISEPDRQWLYEHCEALLFPSLTEGFGLPVVEAMACGKPVFLSDRTSLPEVGGEVGFYWRSFDPEQMLAVFASGMETFGRHPDYARRLVAQARRFSWDRATAEYLQYYREVAQACLPKAA